MQLTSSAGDPLCENRRVITLKANQPELLAEAERLAAARAPDPPCPEQDDSLELWYLPRLDWAAAARDVNVVKTVRQQSHRRQHVEHSESAEKHIVRIVEVEPSTNFYASNLELGSIPPCFLHQLGRSRWDIDTRLFQTLVTEGAQAGSLKMFFIFAIACWDEYLGKKINTLIKR
ncbi:MAG: hypothetical protein NVS1B11_31130 [Terriglobales bacterium]